MGKMTELKKSRMTALKCEEVYSNLYLHRTNFRCVRKFIRKKHFSGHNWLKTGIFTTMDLGSKNPWKFKSDPWLFIIGVHAIHETHSMNRRRSTKSIPWITGDSWKKFVVKIPVKKWSKDLSDMYKNHSKFYFSYRLRQVKKKKNENIDISSR